jgi:hypothetical protein
MKAFLVFFILPAITFAQLSLPNPPSPTASLKFSLSWKDESIFGVRYLSSDDFRTGHLVNPTSECKHLPCLRLPIFSIVASAVADLVPRLIQIQSK